MKFSQIMPEGIRKMDELDGRVDGVVNINGLSMNTAELVSSMNSSVMPNMMEGMKSIFSSVAGTDGILTEQEIKSAYAEIQKDPQGYVQKFMPKPLDDDGMKSINLDFNSTFDSSKVGFKPTILPIEAKVEPKYDASQKYFSNDIELEQKLHQVLHLEPRKEDGKLDTKELDAAAKELGFDPKSAYIKTGRGVLINPQFEALLKGVEVSAKMPVVQSDNRLKAPTAAPSTVAPAEGHHH